MSYIFPKRKLQLSDVVEPDGLNADIMPAAELIDSGLNEHNLKLGFVDDAAPLAPGALQTPHFVVNQMNPDIPLGVMDGAVGHSCVPRVTGSGTGSNGYTWCIPTDGKWHTVGDGPTEETSWNQMKTTFTTGVSRVWINACVQMFWLPDDQPIGRAPSATAWFMGGGGNITKREYGGWIPEMLGGNPYSGGWTACVRFAIRVDGRIIEETITARKDRDERGSPFEMANQTNSERGNTPVGIDSHSISPAATNVRLGCVVELGPGEHVVELVARQAYRNKPTSGGDGINHYEKGQPLEARFVTYNSQLLAVDIPDLPPAEKNAISSPLIQVFEAEDRISDETSARFERLKEKYNNVTADNIALGALNHRHLLSPVLFARRSFLQGDPCLVSVNEQWGGYSNRADVAAGPTLPGPQAGGFWNWSVLDKGKPEQTILGLRLAASESDTADTSVYTHDPGYGTFDTHSGRCFLVVFADVQVVDIDFHGGDRDYADLLACFGLYFTFKSPGSTDSGPLSLGTVGYEKWVPETSWAFFNNTNFNRAAGDGTDWKKVLNKKERFNASLMFVVDMTRRDYRGAFNTQPPLDNDGNPIEFRSVHLTCSKHPDGKLAYADPEKVYGTEHSYVQVGNRSMSAMLLRY